MSARYMQPAAGGGPVRLPEVFAGSDGRRWLDLHARQLRDRISSLRSESRARRGLPPRPFRLLLDSIDELKRTEEFLAIHEDGGTDEPAS